MELPGRRKRGKPKRISPDVIRTGEPEPEPDRGAMEPANFGGAGAGAGAFFNISAEPEPELEPQKFISSCSSNGS